MVITKLIVTVSINREIKEQLTVLLEKEGWTFSSWVERCAREQLKKYEKEVEQNV